MWRKKRKTVLVISAVLYVLFGILAFFNIPGGHSDHHHTFAHNITHIVLGVILLSVTLSCRPKARRWLCFGFGAGYILIGLYGVVAGSHATFPIIPGLIEFHAGDYAVHLATGLFFLVLGCFKRSDKRPAPAEIGGLSPKHRPG